VQWDDPVMKTAVDLGEPALFFKLCIFSAGRAVFSGRIYRTMRQNPGKSSMSWRPLSDLQQWGGAEGII
jgi:hypothetical protein